jgi:hypothetical protein
MVVVAFEPPGGLPAAEEGVLALRAVWPRVRISDCQLIEEPMLAPDDYNEESQPLHQFIWHASACELEPGRSYVVALHMDSVGRSGDNDVTTSVSFEVPNIPGPASVPVSATVKDEDVSPLFASGDLLMEGAADQSDVLQYRVYWGQGNGTIVGNLADENEALAGVANLFAEGGFRNVNDNDCVLGDCDWQFQKVKSEGIYAIRHAVTNDCLCYRGTALEQEECLSELQSLDQDAEYHYIEAGEGTLVSDIERIYLYAQYRDLGIDVAEVRAVVAPVCSADGACVGYHVNTVEDDPQYLEAAILWDGDLYEATHGSGYVWPPTIPPSFSFHGGTLADSTLDPHNNILSTPVGTGPPQYSKTSANVGLGWWKYRSFIKEAEAMACMWTLEEVEVNLTAGPVESRLMNQRHKECVCQVPVAGVATADGSTASSKARSERLRSKLARSADLVRSTPFTIRL